MLLKSSLEAVLKRETINIIKISTHCDRSKRMTLTSKWNYSHWWTWWILENSTAQSTTKCHLIPPRRLWMDLSMVAMKTHGPKSAIESNRSIGFLVSGGLSRDLVAAPSLGPPIWAISGCVVITHRWTMRLVDVSVVDVVVVRRQCGDGAHLLQCRILRCVLRRWEAVLANWLAQARSLFKNFRRKIKKSDSESKHR